MQSIQQDLLHMPHKLKLLQKKMLSIAVWKLFTLYVLSVIWVCTPNSYTVNLFINHIHIFKVVIIYMYLSCTCTVKQTTVEIVGHKCVCIHTHMSIYFLFISMKHLVCMWHVSIHPGDHWIKIIMIVIKGLRLLLLFCFAYRVCFFFLTFYCIGV